MKSVKKQVENDVWRSASDNCANILFSEVFVKIRENTWRPIFFPVSAQVKSKVFDSVFRIIP